MDVLRIAVLDERVVAPQRMNLDLLQGIMNSKLSGRQGMQLENGPASKFSICKYPCCMSHSIRVAHNRFGEYY
jgi:hypothetical protein